MLELDCADDALSATEEAVSIRRQLAAAYPDRYRPDLADSLNNLGVRLSELGRPADALLAEQEAVRIRRELAAANPDRYRPGLAIALSSNAAVGPIGLISADNGSPLAGELVSVWD